MTVQPARAQHVQVHRPAIIRAMRGSWFRRVYAKLSKRLKAKARSRRSPVDRIGKAIEGLWIGAFQGEAAPFFWVTNGLLLLLRLASAGAVIAMASPGVGNRHDAPKWSFAMLGVLPLAALSSVVSHDAGIGDLNDDTALHCLSASLIAAAAMGGALTMWLRRGAPVSQQAAGWFTGIAAGAIGTLLYGFSCPVDSVTHLGIWHVVPVAVAAIAGRLIVPRLIAW